MKTRISILIFILILLSSLSAWALSPAILGVVGGGGAATVTPDLLFNWNAISDGDDCECATPCTSSWTGETDANSILSVASNKLVVNLGTVSQVGYVYKTGLSGTEATIKFKLTFDDILAVGAATTIVQPIYLRDSNTPIAYFTIRTDASGNINDFRVTGTLGNGSYVTLTGIVADTEYECYIYYKEDASTGISQGKIGSWTASTTTPGDNTADDGIAQIQAGVMSNTLGGGTTDTVMRIDDVTLYYSDQR